jgi:hypothetical protein
MFQYTIGIPMGPNCDSQLANIYLSANKTEMSALASQE